MTRTTTGDRGGGDGPTELLPHNVLPLLPGRDEPGSRVIRVGKSLHHLHHVKVLVTELRTSRTPYVMVNWGPHSVQHWP
ncbi:MAG: hypothetical protein ACREX3_09560, partial [Gammaproteobacteria bacterium]